MAGGGAPRWSRALVTGASSGIGEVMARELAAGGTDLVLVARRAELLEALAGDLRAAHGVTVEVLAADLLDAGKRIAVEARLQAEDRPVDLLVNNAGMATSGRFVRLAVEREVAEVDLNVTVPVRLTRAVLPGMVARRSGTVLQVASVAGFQGLPTGVTYAATKAYLITFTEGLSAELRGTGVTVTALCPGFTRTGFVTDEMVRRLPGALLLDPVEVARAGLRDAAAGKVLSVPSLPYKLISTASRLADGPIRRTVIHRFG